MENEIRREVPYLVCIIKKLMIYSILLCFGISFFLFTQANNEYRILFTISIAFAIIIARMTFGKLLDKSDKSKFLSNEFEEFKCRHCDGKGSWSDTYYSEGGKCENCEGTGKEKRRKSNIHPLCHLCGNSGKAWLKYRQVTCSCVEEAWKKENDAKLTKT